MNLVSEHWDLILHKMKNYVQSNTAYKTWILPLKVYDVTEDTVYILVNLASSLDHIEYMYSTFFQVCIEEVTGMEYEVAFVTAEDSSIEEKRLEMNQNISKRKKDLELHQKANLVQKYTFDTFVVGQSNRYAQAASEAVAKNPAQVYNPLLIYGGVGLGKTHLMHSIGNFIIQEYPEMNVLYVTSETFTNEMIEAIRHGKSGNELSMTAFREKYRSVDVLLIDDIQFLIGKSGTQEEFFHTFNHLYTAGKQIILSSDKPPKDMATLEDRLRSRFLMGLSADISKPDYETRMAILRKKINSDGLERFHIPDDVIQYIATNIQSNIRELEGSLSKLTFKSKMDDVPITIPLAAEVLKDLISADSLREVTPELILDVVSEHFSMNPEDIKGKKRDKDIVLPRHIVMFLSRSMTDVPYKNIGMMLGKRDHTTVIHGINRIMEMIEVENDESLINTIDIIKKKINPL